MGSGAEENFGGFGDPEPEVLTPSSRKKKDKKKKEKKRSASMLDSSAERNNTATEGELTKKEASLEEKEMVSSAEIMTLSTTRKKEKKKKEKKRTASMLESSMEEHNATTEIIHEVSANFVTDEPTMEEKLATLGLVNDASLKINAMSELEPERTSTLQPPSADSVHILLKQALHADDHALLLECLYTRDEKVIGKSISLLNPADAMKLLKSLLSMIQLRGAVLICVIPWLKSLISQHASSIVTQESSLLVLNSLYQLIQSRISTFGSAVELSTCLDYLSNQIGDEETGDDDNAPPIIFEDRDTEDEESEDAMETDNDNEETEGLGDVIDASHDSDGSEVMSD